MRQAEFLNMVMPFKDKLFRLAKRLLISTEEAEDATQEIVLRLWTNRLKIAGYDNLEAFAMTMIKNHCLDQLKSKKANTLKLVHSNYTDEDTSLQGQLEAKDSVYWMNKIMQTLPKQQKIIVQLRDIEHYEFAEISTMLEMNPTAIRVALSRARKTIREELIKKHNYGIS